MTVVVLQFRMKRRLHWTFSSFVQSMFVQIFSLKLHTQCRADTRHWSIASPANDSRGVLGKTHVRFGLARPESGLSCVDQILLRIHAALCFADTIRLAERTCDWLC